MAEKLAVISEAKLDCTFSVSTLDLISTNDAGGFYSDDKSIACTNDNASGVNIFEKPGSMCSDGKPCNPKFVQPWMKGAKSVTDCDILLLTEDSCISCLRGGTVTINDPAQDTIVLEVIEQATEKNNENKNKPKPKTKVKLKGSIGGESIELGATVIKEGVEVAEAAGEVGRSAAQAYVDAVKEMGEEVRKNMEQWEKDYNARFNKK